MENEFWKCDIHEAMGNHPSGCPKCRKETENASFLKRFFKKRVILFMIVFSTFWGVGGGLAVNNQIGLSILFYLFAVIWAAIHIDWKEIKKGAKS